MAKSCERGAFGSLEGEVGEEDEAVACCHRIREERRRFGCLRVGEGGPCAMLLPCAP